MTAKVPALIEPKPKEAILEPRHKVICYRTTKSTNSNKNKNYSQS